MKKIFIIGFINIIFLSLVAFFTYNYVMSKKNRVKILEEEIIKLQSEIDSIPISQESLTLSDFVSQKFTVKNINYTLRKKKVSDLTTSKHPGSIGNSYIQSNEGKLFVASAKKTPNYRTVVNGRSSERSTIRNAVGNTSKQCAKKNYLQRNIGDKGR